MERYQIRYLIKGNVHTGNVTEPNKYLGIAENNCVIEQVQYTGGTIASCSRENGFYGTNCSPLRSNLILEANAQDVTLFRCKVETFEILF